MKWHKLFNNLKQFLLYEIDIDLRTTKLLLNIFTESFSKTNYERFKTEIDYLLAFTTKQVSLHNSLQQITNNHLENELNKQLRRKPK